MKSLRLRAQLTFENRIIMLKIVQRCEWLAPGSCCPMCGNAKPEGHKEDCTIKLSLDSLL